MQLFTQLNSWQAFRSNLNPQQSLGFVPTMGCLHQGHASLVEKSCQENHHTLVSIFVNPTQFNNSDDLKNYPQTLEQDLATLTTLGVDYVLLPSQEELYACDYQYQIEEKQLSLAMEGQHRPGHFTGMLTVVMKLLMLSKANRAYFGEKDYQQLELVKGMCKAFFIDTQIIACPTQREKSLLAMSSRNRRLNTQQRQRADAFARIFHQSQSLDEIRTQLKALDITIEYLEEHRGRRYCAVNIGAVRLIDNYAL